MNLPKDKQLKYLEKHELKNNSKRIRSKHQASKKGFRHRVKLSKGEYNHMAFLIGKETITTEELLQIKQ